MNHRLAIICLFVLPILSGLLLTLDQCSKRRVPRSNAEVILYAVWQRIWYRDQIDRFDAAPFEKPLRKGPVTTPRP